MPIANDYARCTGFDCDLAYACERFTSHPDGVHLWVHDAKHGCIGFIDNGQHAQAGGQSVVSTDTRA